jgi:hypothetical protein
MLVPLGVLSVGAVFAGIVFHHPFIEVEEGARFWGASIHFDAHLMHEIHEVPLWVKLAPGIVMIIGFLIALHAYIRSPGFPAHSRSIAACCTPFPLQQMVLRRALQRRLRAPRPWRWAASSGSAGDEKIIDRYGPDGAALWWWPGPASPGACSRATSTPTPSSCCSACAPPSPGSCRGEPRLSHPHADAGGPHDRGRRLPVRQREQRALVALAATLIDLALGILLWATYEVGGEQWQFTEYAPVFGRYFAWALGIDGIALMLIMLSVFLMPICILASWSR